MAKQLQLEKYEWIDSINDIARRYGKSVAEEFVHDVLKSWASGDHGSLLTDLPYMNTIQSQNMQINQPEEAKIAAGWMSWNTVCMVTQAGKIGPELGGHIATYQSIADLYAVGFDYFFRARSQQLEDLVYYQGHSIPGIYARSYIMHELQDKDLMKFRQEAKEPGLSSYPHPWLMPNYWQFPTVSMGLAAAMGIYQARLMRYLEQRELISPSDRRVWVFCGDGEMLEPESTGLLATAARDQLSRLTIVVSCNLQELDGLVNPNGNVVRELAGIFAGAGWRVIQLIWNQAWEALFRSEPTGQLSQLMGDLVDGEFQNVAVNGPEYLKSLIKSRCPSLSNWVDHQPSSIWQELGRGGHDWQLIYRAFQEVSSETQQPTVILAKTVKGHQMGEAFESVNIAHQKKKLTSEELIRLGRQWQVPLSDEALAKAEFFRPDQNHPVVKYLHQQRRQLGGLLPCRHSDVKQLPEVPLSAFKSVLGQIDREMSTTMAFVRILGVILRQKDLKDLVVPMVPDEARTFGMEGLFKQLGIYAPHGQHYQPHDVDHVAAYRESAKGQFLQEGLCEAGAISSWIAAATAYANHQVPLIPFYVFYSMFGFQRVGDFIWAAADSRARGFLIGATSGRTTLAGEGLQHNDGHSHVLMSVVPNCESYDPTFAYELAVIVQDGLRRMYHDQEDVFYYITVMNENYTHPAMPEGAEEGILRGMYPLQQDQRPVVRLLGSGTILREVIEAARQLTSIGVPLELWSVTSFTRLGREGIKQHQDLLNGQECQQTWVESHLPGSCPVIAASDYMRAFPDQIRSQIQASYFVLGTDGFGRSDTRKNLRDFHQVSSQHVLREVLRSLSNNTDIDKKLIGKYQVSIQQLLK